MMKRLIVLIALAAAPAALAAAQPKAVSIDALPNIVTFGSPTTLTGSVTPAQAVEVHVASTLCLNAPTRVERSAPLSLKSGADGSWSAIVAPQVRTSYQATAKGAQSETVMVQVRPRVTLVRLSRHVFRTRAFAAKSFAGRNVLFQKRTAVGWTTVKRVTLHLLSSSTDAVVSGRTFHSRVSVRRTVRILLPQIVAGNCYAPGISNSVRG